MHNNDILQISYLIYGMYDGLLFYAHLFDLEIKDHDHIWYEGCILSVIVW